MDTIASAREPIRTPGEPESTRRESTATSHAKRSDLAPSSSRIVFVERARTGPVAEPSGAAGRLPTARHHTAPVGRYPSGLHHPDGTSKEAAQRFRPALPAVRG